MKKLRLKRISECLSCTMGVILDDLTGIPIFTSLEKPWLLNRSGISCIPKGVYHGKRYSSKKYKDVYQITDVVDRTYILIHSGNIVSDTEGCILIGKGFGIIDGEPAVVSSRNAMIELNRLLKDDEFHIIIE